MLLTFTLIYYMDNVSEQITSNIVQVVSEGEYLKRAIRANGMTIEEAAKKLDISSSYLHVFLKKEFLPTDFKKKVEEALTINFEHEYEIKEPLDAFINMWNHPFMQRVQNLVNQLDNVIRCFDLTYELLRDLVD